jgi:hypothetical protein
MHLIVGVIIALATIYFMVISPGFRTLVFVVACGFGLLIYFVIRNSNQESEHQQAEAARKNAASLSAISENELSMTDVTLSKEYSWWTLKGIIKNNSAYPLSSVTFVVTMRDCPPQRDCLIIGQQSASVSTPVPSGQVRSFSSYAIDFKNMPTASNPKWDYKVTEVRAAF